MFRLIGSALVVLVIISTYYAANHQDVPVEDGAVAAPASPAQPTKNFNL